MWKKEEEMFMVVFLTTNQYLGDYSAVYLFMSCSIN